MSKEEILDKAKYIQFPLNPYVYKEYPSSVNINRLPIGIEYMYIGWDKNHNHFKTSYHREFVLPLIDRLFSIGMNMSDFNIVEKSCATYDISMLYPKTDIKFDVYNFKDDKTEENLSYEDLITSNRKANWITDYHRLYRYPHESSIVKNKTINNNKRLFIIGDSQMIPDIGPLSCYYKEVWYMDNRDRVHVVDKYKDVDFDDVLFELNCSDINKHLTDISC